MLTLIFPVFLLTGLSLFDPSSKQQDRHHPGITLLGVITLAGAPILAVLGAQVYSRELVVTPDGIARRSLLLNRSIPFARIESMKVRVTDAEEPGTERLTVRSDDGQKIEIDSGMPGYRTLLELLPRGPAERE